MRRKKTQLFVYDRVSHQTLEEKIYGGSFIKLLYSKNPLSWLVGSLLLPILCKLPYASRFYGWLQKQSVTKAKVKPFIKKFALDPSEFQLEPSQFTSFNDFFIRKLKPEARPIEQDPTTIVMPADGRYLAYPNLYEMSDIWVKGKSLNIGELLGHDPALTKLYEWGSLLLARLAPVDYHRFHFPCDCTPGETKLMNGPLYSVNPIALKRNINYLAQNKRTLTLLQTEQFGQIAFIEVGATHVGTIHQTYTPNTPQLKGDEKGYFSFGGSSLLLLFEPNRILFSQDLIDQTQKRCETRALMGQMMGVCE